LEAWGSLARLLLNLPADTSLERPRNERRFTDAVVDQQSGSLPTMASQPSDGKRTRSQSTVADEFEQLGMAIMQRRTGGSEQTRNRRFRSHFGVTPEICAHVWGLLDPTTLPEHTEKKHLLWSLMFLMLYETESINCTMVGGG